MKKERTVKKTFTLTVTFFVTLIRLLFRRETVRLLGWMGGNALKKCFAGTAILVRLALRRDRFKLLGWVVGITLLIYSVTATYVTLSMEEITAVIAMRVINPGVRAFDAPISGLSLGEFTMMRVTLLCAVLFALISAQTVIRHTRYNEQTGCAEMIGSTVVGRYSSLFAAILVGVGANILLAICAALALIANGLPAPGSFAAGAAFGAVGIVFVGIAAFLAQIMERARGANGLAGVVLGFSVLVSSTGSILGEITENGLGFKAAWPIWFSPVGWSTQVQAFDQNNWWILWLFTALFLVMVCSSFALVGRRDMGAGLLRERRGRAAALRSLLSPLGLAWRLQRGLLLGWAFPILIFGLVFGSISDEFGATIEGIDLPDQLLLTADVILFTIIGFAATIIVIYTIQALLRMRTEESYGTLEPVLGTAVSRIRWMGSHIVCCVFGTTALSQLFALSIALGANSTASEAIEFSKAALYNTSSILTLAGFTILVIGLVPRWAKNLAWVSLLISLLAGPMFGPIFNLSEAVMKASPFTHIHVIPSEVSAVSVIVLLVVTVVLTGLGLLSFRKRNLSLLKD